MSKKVESSRYANKTAWFHGDESQGDYYDHHTGKYLGSWSRAAGQFSDPNKTQDNLFDFNEWKKRNKKKKTASSTIVSIVDQIKEIVVPPSDPLQLEGQYIAFVGDSFCATIDRKHLSLFSGPRFNPHRHSRSANTAFWPSIVIDQLGQNLAHYGFGGRSWWYSWNKFWSDWNHRLNDLHAVVFLHTNHDRLNNSIDDELFHLPHDTARKRELFKDESRDNAVKLYYAYIHDCAFNQWCQQQYFKTIRELLPEIRQIHFFCFSVPSQITCDILPGIRFTTPLAALSAAELDATGRLPLGDPRANHFNEHNNRAMAQLVIDALRYYSPRISSIPLDGWDLQVEPNGSLWPHFYNQI